jgi:hypothetical protein
MPGCCEQTATGPVAEALRDAVRDLERLGLTSHRERRVELAQAGRELAAESLRMLWPEIMGVYLDNEQLTFLQACVRLCEERHPDVALLRSIAWQQVTGALGWANPDFSLGLSARSCSRSIRAAWPACG